MGMIENSLKSAIKKGEKTSQQYASKVVDLQEELIEKQNWQMTAIQKICNHLKIKLDDPLELEEKK